MRPPRRLPSGLLTRMLRSPSQARGPTVQGGGRFHFQGTSPSSSGCASSQSTGCGSASVLAAASAAASARWRAMAMATGKLSSQLLQSQPNLARAMLPWIWCSARCKPAVNIFTCVCGAVPRCCRDLQEDKKTNPQRSAVEHRDKIEIRIEHRARSVHTPLFSVARPRAF